MQKREACGCHRKFSLIFTWAGISRARIICKQTISDNLDEHTIIAHRAITNFLCSMGGGGGGGVQNLVMHDKRIIAFCVKWKAEILCIHAYMYLDEERKKEEGGKVENKRQP